MAKKWTEFVVGFIMIISPWVLGFSDITVAKWFNVLIGLFLILMNAWVLFGAIAPSPAIPVEQESKKKKEAKK